MLLNYILALLKYMLELLKNKLVLIKINFYFDNTILYFNNSQLACPEIQIDFVEHHVSLYMLYTMFFISNDSIFLTCNSTLRLTCCSASFHFCETTLIKRLMNFSRLLGCCGYHVNRVKHIEGTHLRAFNSDKKV